MTDYKYFGLLAVIILVSGLAFVALKWPEGRHLSFSQHVAKHKGRIIYYSILFAVALPLLLLFFLGWFIPTFNLSFWFGLFIVASSVTQYACTLIPEAGGWKTRYHRLLAGASAIFLIPALFTLLLSNSIEIVAKLVIFVSLAIMLGVIFQLAKNKGQHHQFLLLQSAYFIAFFVPILLIAYT